MVGVPDATELDTARPQTAGNFLLNFEKVCLDLIIVAVIYIKNRSQGLF